MNRRQLVQEARAMRAHAYAPYSRFAVGAALLGANGRVYGGCNVENASYGLTVCAERTAYLKAVTDGCREFVALAVATQGAVSPCGACLQVAREFGAKLTILLADIVGEPRETTLARLLPSAFVGRTLQRDRDVHSRGTAEERREVGSRRKRH